MRGQRITIMEFHTALDKRSTMFSVVTEAPILGRVAPTAALPACRRGSQARTERIAIARRSIEQTFSDGSTPTFIETAKAQALVASKQATWSGRRQILMYPDTSKKSLWAVRGASAIYSDGLGLGPKFCNLQLI